MKYRILGSILVLVVILSSCHKDNNRSQPTPSNQNLTRNYDATTLLNNFTMMCRLSKSTAGFFPPQVARAYGYVGIAAYEAVVAGIPGAKSLAGQIQALQNLPQPQSNQTYNWAISSNAAATQMMRYMFDLNLTQTTRNAIDSLEAANLAMLSNGVSTDVISRSVQFGKSISAAIYTVSTTDGGHQSYVDPFQMPFTLPVADYCWIPTGAAKQPISPYWGKNRAFIAANVDRVIPVDHTTFSADPNSKFYSNAMEVYNQVKNNTPEQVQIVKFWADDPFNTCTPTGHTFNIMVQLLKESNVTLEKASVALAKLSIAENDAFISCWKGKYQYMLIRPVSYIKEYIDPSFTTVIGTPGFPSYTSGHSYEIGAAVKVFTQMFTNGDGNYDFTDYSQVQFGYAARHYTNFAAMALECANSRFYGGIHYNEDNTEGLKCGGLIGDNVNNMLVWPLNIK